MSLPVSLLAFPQVSLLWSCLVSQVENLLVSLRMSLPVSPLKHHLSQQQNLLQNLLVSLLEAHLVSLLVHCLDSQLLYPLVM
jgi:hypothetical protein